MVHAFVKAGFYHKFLEILVKPLKTFLVDNKSVAFIIYVAGAVEIAGDVYICMLL